MTGSVVVDASAVVDLLTRAPSAAWVEEQLLGRTLAAPAHLKAEALSALGRGYRAGATPSGVERAIGRLATLHLQTHVLEPLLLPAWRRRDHLRLADALYVELAAQLDTVVVTTDRRLARATPLAVAPPG